MHAGILSFPCRAAARFPLLTSQRTTTVRNSARRELASAEIRTKRLIDGDRKTRKRCHLLRLNGLARILRPALLVVTRDAAWPAPLPSMTWMTSIKTIDFTYFSKCCIKELEA